MSRSLEHLTNHRSGVANLRWTNELPRPNDSGPVPLVSPFRLAGSDRALFDEACRAIIDRSAYRTSEGWSDRAAQLFADSIGVEHASEAWAVTMFRSGTDALVRALLGCGVRPGDRVAIPDLAFHAVASAVLMIGAVPVPIDISADDWCMNPAALEATCSPGSVAAVIAVDNYGTPCDSSRLAAATQKLGAPLILDACESLGATRPDGPVVLHADAVVVSFSFTKPIHAAGMGGALAIRRRLTTNYDGVRWTDAQYALPEINAAHLVHAWPSLESNIERLRYTYTRYEEVARQFGLEVQHEHGKSTRIHAPFLLPSWLAGRRSQLITALEAAGVSCRAQFPSQSELLGLGQAPDVSRDTAARVFSVPTGAGLPVPTVEFVAQTLAHVLSQADFEDCG